MYNYQFGATKLVDCIKCISHDLHMHFVPGILILYFYFQVTEQSQLVVATNADAEVTERAVPGESLSPSNVQLTPMAVPSPFTDNASTLASLRMVSYLEGFRLMYPPPFLHVHFSSHYLQNPSSFLCPLGRLTRIL
jgi:hypothetical protein